MIINHESTISGYNINVQDQFELIRQQPGFSELALQAWTMADRAEAKLQEAKAEFEAALKALNRAEEASQTYRAHREKMLELGERLSFPRELVEDFCRHELSRSKEDADPEGAKKRRLPNSELMIFVAEMIAQKNRPVNLEEILEAIAEHGILLPGAAPEKNMLAYLSRSPLIRSVKRGWYDYDPLLLEAARRQMKGTQGHE